METRAASAIELYRIMSIPVISTVPCTSKYVCSFHLDAAHQSLFDAAVFFGGGGGGGARGGGEGWAPPPPAPPPKYLFKK